MVTGNGNECIYTAKRLVCVFIMVLRYHDYILHFLINIILSFQELRNAKP